MVLTRCIYSCLSFGHINIIVKSYNMFGFWINNRQNYPLEIGKSILNCLFIHLLLIIFEIFFMFCTHGEEYNEMNWKRYLFVCVYSLPCGHDNFQFVPPMRLGTHSFTYTLRQLKNFCKAPRLNKSRWYFFFFFSPYSDELSVE